MQIKPTVKYHLTLVRMDSIKKDKKKNVVDDVKKRELLCIVGGNGTGAATIENYTEFPQEIENRTTI